MYSINPSITLPLLEGIWKRVSGRPSFWEETDGHDFDTFLRNLVDSRTFILFDYGFARIETGWNGSVGNIHAVFWDRKVVRSILEIKAALADAAEVTSYFEFTACVPAGAKRLRKLLCELGFRQRGEISRYYEIRGGFQKAIVYGILRSEVQDGR